MENDMMAIVMAAGKGTRMKSKKSKLVQKRNCKKSSGKCKKSRSS